MSGCKRVKPQQKQPNKLATFQTRGSLPLPGSALCQNTWRAPAFPQHWASAHMMALTCCSGICPRGYSFPPPPYNSMDSDPSQSISQKMTAISKQKNYKEKSSGGKCLYLPPKARIW